MNIAGNRQDVADKFWSDVEKLLTGEYQRSPKTARRGIDAYRQEVDSHKLGEVIFNQGEEQAARVVDGLIEHGNPIPNPA